jgi:N-acyl-L-homoserine lactone synthetase
VILVLEGTQRAQLSYYFEMLFSLRHQIFIKEMGWNLPTSQGTYEIDDYDVDQATYIIDLIDDDVIQGAVRLTPSESCSLVADYFPHLIENGLSARSPLVCEATRYLFLPLAKRADENRAAKARLLSAMVEWCNSMHMSFVQCIVDMKTFPSWLELVPQTIPLGLPHPYGGGPERPGGGNCIAFRWPATEEVVQAIRNYGGISHSPRFFQSGGVPGSYQLTH